MATYTRQSATSRDIGVDLDGVLYDFVGTLGAYAARRGLFAAAAAVPPASCWEFYAVDWGWTFDEFLHVTADGIRAGEIFTVGKPLPGALEGWQRLRTEGHRLHVVTDRAWPGAAVEAKDATLRWLHRYGFDADTVTFTADKTQILAVADNPAGTAFIDDRADNVAALDDGGVEAWLLDRPWNQHHVTARRAHTICEFAAKVSGRLVPACR